MERFYFQIPAGRRFASMTGALIEDLLVNSRTGCWAQPAGTTLTVPIASAGIVIIPPTIFHRDCDLADQRDGERHPDGGGQRRRVPRVV